MPTSAKSLVALGALAAAAAVAAPSPAALASTYTANHLGDHPLNGCSQSDCTLREAVRGANHHPGPDTIVLRGGKVYNLAITGKDEQAAATGDLDVTQTLTIEHSGAQEATIDANFIDRILDVHAGTATVRGIVVRAGAYYGSSNPDRGGAIAVEPTGRLVLSHAVVAGSQSDQGGGIWVGPGGFAELNHSTVRENNALGGAGGGGIWTNGKVRVVDSTVQRNFTNGGGGGGGGIQLFGAGSNVSILRSTVSRNTAANASGGGIRNVRGQLRIRNSTIANNRAYYSGGGIMMEVPMPAGPTPLTLLNNVTIARNVADSDDMNGGDGGGIAEFADAGGSFKVGNSLIALNTVGSSGGFNPNCVTAHGVTSLGHNLRGTADPFCVGFGAVGDIVRAQPKLAPLDDYGGPTETIRLNAGSPAIGKADPSTAENRDQRGAKRDASPDIGSFEH